MFKCVDGSIQEAGEDLRLADLVEVLAACGTTDPGDDEFDDPDPYHIGAASSVDPS